MSSKQPKKVTLKANQDKDITESLKGYTLVKDVTKLKPGDSIRYKSDGTFKKGGIIKLIHEKYIVLLNPISKTTWSVQLMNPTLQLWCKSLESKKQDMNDAKEFHSFFENYDKDQVMNTFEKLKGLNIDNVLKIYKMYNSGQLIKKSSIK